MLFGKFLISNPEEMIIFAIITNINQKTNIMKRFFAILSVVMLAGLLACAAPKKKSRVKKAVNKTAKKAASKTKKTAVPKEVLLEFRLVYQAAANRNCSSSAVMSCSQGNYGDYVYYRALGDNEAMSYDFAKGVCTSLMLELSRIAEHKHLSSNKFTKLDDPLTTHQFERTLAVADTADAVCIPLIGKSQKPTHSALARPLFCICQNDTIVKFTSRIKDTLDSSVKQQLRNGGRVIRSFGSLYSAC